MDFNSNMVIGMRTISDIIEAAGGPGPIASRLPVKLKADGSPRDRSFSVYKWKQFGIPERHWPLIIELTGVTPQALFVANQRLRTVERAA